MNSKKKGVPPLDLGNFKCVTAFGIDRIELENNSKVWSASPSVHDMLSRANS